jgi:hypothetical protein
MDNRRAAWCPPLTVLALALALGRVPAPVAAAAAAVIAIVLAAVLLAPDPRSVPQRMLLLIALLQRTDPRPWLDPPHAAPDRGAARQAPDTGRGTPPRTGRGKGDDGRGTDTGS